jgi:hypothetical protein
VFESIQSVAQQKSCATEENILREVIRELTEKSQGQ